MAGIISDEDYAELVNFTRQFLQGKDRQVISTLVEKMEVASQSLAFEKAALYRDQIQRCAAYKSSSLSPRTVMTIWMPSGCR